MISFLCKKQWGVVSGGIALAFIFVLAFVMVKPIGVSTQFVILDGIIWNAVSDGVVKEDSDAKRGYSSENAYLNKSGGKYAANIANPLNYSFVFVLAMIFGGFIAYKIGRGREDNCDTSSCAPEEKKCSSKSLIMTFVGGILVLFGARLAGGCTSGHMMSGMMQTSLSGYLFAIAVFAFAIPVAILIYKKV